MDWIDISVPIESGMVHWPGDPEVRIERVSDVLKGDKNTLSEICMGAHSGTHMDAPSHFIRDGIGIDELPFDAVIGPVRVIEISDNESIKADELERHDIGPGQRVLFRTKNSSHVWGKADFIEDFVYLSTDAAHYLVEREIKTVGIDYLSVGGYKGNGTDVHRALLGAGIWLIEGLDLSKVSAGDYELVCLPLRIVDGDGAPARALVRPLIDHD
ncbi:MAG: cyclase family protein [Chloroflexi bacterium]|jgi:arylformamidase|nr:cyclase family protein [Chloroflexota bacterium]MBT7080604.1 cyclase family protein [Chloroflexota bacterium]MBT7290358.1 cyclase family protein [Chloroflexota bacterium]